jgi:asparagine synthetase B (glutamine-hydrolysing)
MMAKGTCCLMVREICNYNDARAELRSKGYQFTTRKDTELSWQHTLNGVRNSLKRKTECGS